MTVGSICLVRVAGTGAAPVLRPAICIADVAPTMATVRVFMDVGDDQYMGTLPDYGGGLDWLATLPEGGAVAEWRPL